MEVEAEAEAAGTTRVMVVVDFLAEVAAISISAVVVEEVVAVAAEDAVDFAMGTITNATAASVRTSAVTNGLESSIHMVRCKFQLKLI